MIVVDTGVLFAAADRNDPIHDACASLLSEHHGPLMVPVPVVVETAWMMESRLGASSEAEFLRSVAEGELTRVDLVDDDWARAADLVDRYADLPLGLVDASVVAVAERLGARVVATINQRDFLVVRPRHVDAFELLP